MKKLILIHALLMVFTNTFAQIPVDFKIQYLPNQTYTSITQIKLFNRDEALQPAFMSHVSTLIIETGKEDKNKKFPYKATFSLKEEKMGGQDMMAMSDPHPLSDKEIYAHGDKYGINKIDSIQEVKDVENAKSSAFNIIKGCNQNISFPDKPLKIGESFSRETMIQIPIAGKILLPLTTTYTLIDFKDNIAVFETESAMDINFTLEQGNGIGLKGTGYGKGKLVFNISKHYPESITNELELNYRGSRVSIDIITDIQATKMKMVTEIKNQITSN